jgi:hypothetical protein
MFQKGCLRRRYGSLKFGGVDSPDLRAFFDPALPFLLTIYVLSRQV